MDRSSMMKTAKQKSLSRRDNSRIEDDPSTLQVRVRINNNWIAYILNIYVTLYLDMMVVSHFILCLVLCIYLAFFFLASHRIAYSGIF